MTRRYVALTMQDLKEQHATALLPTLLSPRYTGLRRSSLLSRVETGFLTMRTHQAGYGSLPLHVIPSVKMTVTGRIWAPYKAEILLLFARVTPPPRAISIEIDARRSLLA